MPIVEAVYGSIVDVRFAGESLPRIRDALRVDDGSDRTLEVLSHLEKVVCVRCVCRALRD